MLRYETILICFLLLNNIVLPQSFTRITTGAVVTDGGHGVGCSWADFDNDGDQDLYITNGVINGAEVNFLYQNNGDGTFTRIIGNRSVQEDYFSESSSWGDFNNDGALDLFVGNSRFGSRPWFDFLFVSNGSGNFQKISGGDLTSLQYDSRSVSWVDYDNDGLLDVFIANEGGRNYLYRNNGDSTFSSIDAGSLTSDVRVSAACAWADYDLDGDVDVFVGNLNNQNNGLYRNDGGNTFTRISSGDIVSNGGNSIGCSWADYNNDGYPDLFVANFNNQGNFLYQNNGDGTFTRITSGDIVSNGGSTFGSAWGDYDNDGYLDLFVTNLSNQNNFLYRNLGDGTFERITGEDIVNNGGQSEGCAWADYDRDGDLDMYAVNFDGDNNFLYRNNGNSNNWINLLLKGSASNHSAIGARVKVKKSAGWQYREVSGQTGYQSQNSLNVEFGLGAATQIDSIVVSWPSGAEDVFLNVQSNQFLTITENGSITGIGQDDQSAIDGFELYQNYPNPFNPQTTIRFYLPQTAEVDLAIYNTLGKRIKTLLNEVVNAGEHRQVWNGKVENGEKASSGIYFYRLKTEKKILSRQMALLQ